MSKTYGVKVPIAGHAYIEVQADSEEEAVDAALQEVSNEHLESWEALQQFNRGNICYCPSPWEAEAEVMDDDAESADD